MPPLFLDDQHQVRNGWKVLGYAACAVALGFIPGFVPRALRPPGAGPGIDFLIFLGAAWACLRLEGAPLASIGFRIDGRWARELAFGTLGGFALMGATALVILALGGFHWTRTPGIGPAALAKGLLLYLGVGFAEETGFRGYAFQRLIRGLGVPAAQILFALAFALVHWGNPGMSGATRIWATLNIALAALLLGLAYLRTRSLALPIGIHLGWNWTQGTLLGFGVSGNAEAGWWTPTFRGRPEWLTGGAFGLEASLPCVLVCGAAILLLARWKGRVPTEGIPA
jgi:membrane protease YdiL (CAAX protease family)